ncbi:MULTISPECIES: hypothetical protein [unclassified Campylobacter]|uniref:hypothetical protein n=1 Tax=unclassified Campylobacter TaxID=2593542 RepID=UPI001DE9A4A2|nr:hypothetical protein [Campylobacter sp. RM12651]MBZ7978515.1 hypothetical protein [Campylobacter sp. RM12654]MBZ7980432.1 hypothetical protein [Campylobacter sp. RM12642]MBZ7990591.1 hypothetical protein [Campylobacter sp. RM9331]MBZ8004770.1 hypothetical protein [Campylobacter sp. RM9332]ULO04421.1 putative membrane protein [Campylobacter sp. RM12651]
MLNTFKTLFTEVLPYAYQSNDFASIIFIYLIPIMYMFLFFYKWFVIGRTLKEQWDAMTIYTSFILIMTLGAYIAQYAVILDYKNLYPVTIFIVFYAIIFFTVLTLFNILGLIIIKLELKELI